MEGVIDEIYPPVWTTVDGVGPVSPTEEDVKHTVVHIRTPVQLSVKRVFSGSSKESLLGTSSNSHSSGGRLVTRSKHSSGMIPSKRAPGVIVFLAKGNPGGPASNVEEQALYPKMHLIVKGDFAQGPIKEIPMGDLLRQLERKP